jgi:hypothetical protein
VKAPPDRSVVSRAGSNEMNEDQLLQLRSSIEGQLRWALQHNGDEELVDILRSESERLSEIIDAPRCRGVAAPHSRSLKFGTL